MKVIHLISGGDTGGAKTHIHYLLSGLCSQIDATLVCFMEGEFSKEAAALGIPTIVMEDGIPTALKKLKAMIKQGGYELIHSHGARGNVMAMLLRKSCGIPVITTVHSDPKLDYLGRPMAALTYGSANALAIKRTDYLVGVSDSMRELLIERGADPNSVFSIYNGVDFSIVPHCEDKIGYLKSLGLDCDNDSVVVGIAARLDPVKDVATLIKGFAEGYKSCERLRLVIAGNGMEMEALKSLAAELGVEKAVAFPGWIDDINTFFGAIDINTLTSLSETFPYALTEGSRAKLATVASRVGGVPRLIEDGKTGYLFAAGDYAKLGQRLAQLAKDPELREKMGGALYEKARDEFSVEATTRRQIDIYTEVLRRQALLNEGKRDGVIICGAYGMGNAGDDAILEAIIGEMRGISPFMPITALSRDPKGTRLRYGVESVHMFNYPAFRRVMKRTKLYLSGGGSLIQNVTSRRSLWYYLFTISSAKRLGNAVMMYGCGIGPIVDSRDEGRIRKTLNNCVDVITLREAYSLKELERLQISKPKMLVASDPALSIVPASQDRVDEELKKYDLDPKEGYVCFSVRDWAEFPQKAAAFAQTADYAYESFGLMPVFILINYKEDMEATETVRALMKNPSKVISEPMSPALTMGVLSRMKTMVSMRLHGLIFAASQGIPLVGVSYDPKVTAFLASLGEERCIPFDEVEGGELSEMFSKAVLRFDDDESRRELIERLKAAEAINSQWAEKLLKS